MHQGAVISGLILIIEILKMATHVGRGVSTRGKVGIKLHKKNERDEPNLETNLLNNNEICLRVKLQGVKRN